MNPFPQNPNLMNNYNRGSNFNNPNYYLPSINNFNAQQPPQPMQPMQPPSNDPNYRPLNVRDALSYLDKVKLQFSNNPTIYNQFLDIMKDFKSQE